jgi:16S rRNA (guanine966-N2)-methyltransferase
VIGTNLKSLGVETRGQVLKAEASKACRQLEGQEVMADFVFLDPPYRMKDEYGRILDLLARSRLLGESSVVIAEHEKKFDPGETFGRLRRYRRLDQGDAGLSFYRRTP